MIFLTLLILGNSVELRSGQGSEETHAANIVVDCALSCRDRLATLTRAMATGAVLIVQGSAVKCRCRSRHGYRCWYRCWCRSWHWSRCRRWCWSRCRSRSWCRRWSWCRSRSRGAGAILGAVAIGACAPVAVRRGHLCRRSRGWSYAISAIVAIFAISALLLLSPYFVAVIISLVIPVRVSKTRHNESCYEHGGDAAHRNNFFCFP